MVPWTLQSLSFGLVLILIVAPAYTQPIENFLSVPIFVGERGYPCEDHSVISPDGFVLGLHRIPKGLSAEDGPEKRPVVLLYHGALYSSFCFVIGPKSKALAFLLADAGFDVWMANARGNLFSQRHMNMTLSDKDYWNFSFEEMALKDFPAILDYIREQTGQEKLSFIGHSMGSTIFFSALALKPELNTRIKVMIGLAPASTLNHVISPVLRAIGPFLSDLQVILNTMGIYGFANNPLVNSAIRSFCDLSIITENICKIVLSKIIGYDIPEWDQDTYRMVFSTFPTGFSFRTIVHYAQIRSSKKLQRYDYGPESNLKRYGQSEPPIFDLRTITVPVALFWGKNDWTVSPGDVKILSEQLPNIIGSYPVDWPYFNHLDFLFAKNVVPMLYKNVLKILMIY